MSSVHLALSDDIVVVGYFALVLFIGIYTRRAQKDAGDYFAGGHQVSWPLAGISHYMSGFSAFTFIVYSQIAYQYGLVAILLFWMSVPACIVGGRFFASRWRRARIITPVEFLEQRCGFAVRQLFAWSSIPAKIFEDSLKLFTTALFLSVSAGLNMTTSIVVCGAIMVIYTMLGGLLALVVTNYILFLMKVLAILLLLPVAIIHLGGVHASFHSIPPALLHWTNGPYGWTYVVGYGVLVMISYNGSWAFAQKFYSVPDEKSARKVGYLSAVLNFVGTPILLLPAVIGHGLLPDMVAQHRGNDVYIELVFRLLPAGMFGVIVAALFSATMATVSADLNVIASVLTKDFWQRVLRPGASDREQVYAGRLITGILGVIIVLLSLWIAGSHSESLFQLMVTAFGVLLAPTMIPLLALLCWRKLHSTGAYAGFAAGLISGVGTLLVRYALQRSANDPTGEMDYRIEGISIFVSVFVTFAAMWVTTMFCKPSENEVDRTKAFFLLLDTPIGDEAVSSSAYVGTHGSPNRLIAGSTIAVGGLLTIAGLLAPGLFGRRLDLIIGTGLTIYGLFRLWQSFREDRAVKLLASKLLKEQNERCS
jgi:SSS family transporter